jgi:hypothetical protein
MVGAGAFRVESAIMLKKIEPLPRVTGKQAAQAGYGLSGSSSAATSFCSKGERLRLSTFFKTFFEIYRLAVR